MTLGEQIRQAREKKNLSQEELAERLGVSRQAVSKWENDSAAPQGINREVLSQILEMEPERSKEAPDKSRNRQGLLGWLTAAILMVVLLMVVGNQPAEVPADAGAGENPTPAVTSVVFYDGHQNPVEAEALWYNSAFMESVLIQWTGGTPESIRAFSTPSGSATLEQTDLLLTKAVLDGDTVELLDADPLKTVVQGHVFFELDFGGGVIVSTDTFEIFCDENAG